MISFLSALIEWFVCRRIGHSWISRYPGTVVRGVTSWDRCGVCERERVIYDCGASTLGHGINPGEHKCVSVALQDAFVRLMRAGKVNPEFIASLQRGKVPPELVAELPEDMRALIDQAAISVIKIPRPSGDLN